MSTFVICVQKQDCFFFLVDVQDMFTLHENVWKIEIIMLSEWIFAWLILSLSKVLKLKKSQLVLFTLIFFYICFPTLYTCVCTSSSLFNTISDINQHPKSSTIVLLVVIFHRFISFLLSFISSCCSCAHALVRFLYLTYILLMVFLYMYIEGIEMNEHVMNKFSLLFFLLYFSFVCWSMNE
jgi:hypothetical protein